MLSDPVNTELENHTEQDGLCSVLVYTSNRRITPSLCSDISNSQLNSVLASWLSEHNDV